MQSKDLSLWQLTNEQQNLLSQLYDHETGEVNELVQAKLEQLNPTIENKCLNVSKWIRKIESEGREIDVLISELQKRKAAYEKEVERHLNYLEFHMEKSGVKEISCPFFTVKLKKNPHSTDIIDQEAIPRQFIKVKEVVKVTETADKNMIKEEVLRTGIQVPGALVAQKNKLIITTSKL